ncbi:MAG: MATE family efflux transporter [Firmicutes bacterium]|nr:MATE family efflux transporter [Bacillota bacterium]
MDIQLSDHFTYKRLLRFTLPAIGMMVVMSSYTVVDGLFISNVVGKSAFSAVNLMWPFTGLFGAVGLMVGTGGSALVAKTMGEGDREKAKQIFTMLIAVLIGLGLALACAGVASVEWVALKLGAEEALLQYCITYGIILFAAIPAYMLQMAFQTLLITAEKPQMAFILSIASGVTNILLDFLLIYVFPFGIAGAAVATIMGQIIGGFIPLIYFSRKNSSLLRFVKFKWDGKSLFKACTNGVSEMISNLSFSFLNILYNYQLLRLLGENGVAAYGIIMYVAYIFAGVFMGYSVGCAPIISYHYGAQNEPELKNMFKKSNVIIGGFALVLTLLAELTAPFLADCFVGYDPELKVLAIYALRLYSICFLLCGFNMFASALFTALNNGLVSGLLSGVRMMGFEASMVILIPIIWGVKGIWLSVLVAEILALLMNICVYLGMNKRYHYL